MSNLQGDKEELINEFEHAVTHVAFFYVENFNIFQEEANEQFALGREFSMVLPLQEKLEYHSDKALRSIDYNGHRPAGSRILGNSIEVNTQVYNIPKFHNFHDRDQPTILKDDIKRI